MTTRRSFLRTVALAMPFAAAAAARPPIRVTTSLRDATKSLVQGLQFGAAEAQHTAKLVGRTFELRVVTANPDIVAAKDLLLRGRWHVRPDAGTYAQALAAAKQKHPAARIVAWHPHLERFGAGDLNKRYRAETGMAMDEDAWFGWVAMKILLEAALRNHDIAATRVDGHKGVPLRFNEHFRLQQPLYVVVNGKVVDA